jgi:hypothetical protein
MAGAAVLILFGALGAGVLYRQIEAQETARLALQAAERARVARTGARPRHRDASHRARRVRATLAVDPGRRHREALRRAARARRGRRVA